jgi:hypothetical protein
MSWPHEQSAGSYRPDREYGRPIRVKLEIRLDILLKCQVSLRGDYPSKEARKSIYCPKPCPCGVVAATIGQI